MTIGDTTQVELLKAVHADLDESLPRQVYADWLEEQGRSGDATVVRLVDDMRSDVYARKMVSSPFDELICVCGIRMDHRYTNLPEYLLQRWWGCDCAETVLDRFQSVEQAKKPKQFIQLARKYCQGDHTFQNLKDSGFAFERIVNTFETGTVPYHAAYAVRVLAWDITPAAARAAADYASKSSANKMAEEIWQYLRAVEYHYDLIPHPWFDASENSRDSD